MKKDVCRHCLENESVRVKHEGDRGQPAQLRGDYSKRPAAAANPPPEPPSVLTTVLTSQGRSAPLELPFPISVVPVARQLQLCG